MKDLKISIDCGEKTCAKEPGIFCHFLSVARFGTETICALFQSDKNVVVKNNCCTELNIDEDKSSDTYGWTLRCEKCIELTASDLSSKMNTSFFETIINKLT